MAGPTNRNELNDITFESGVDGNNNIASPSFDTWNGNSPPGYNATTSNIGRWHNDASGNTIGTTSTAGSASGTITYSFGAGVTESEKTAFANTLDLWSDESGLKFVPLTSGTADVLFKVTSSGGSSNLNLTHYTNFNGSMLDGVNQPNIANYLTPGAGGGGSNQDTIVVNNSDGFGRIGDFSTQGGYGVGVLTHEIGHMIGLGHSGPYDDGNAGNNPDAQQYNEFDSRQWSVMSYINPNDTSAKYYNQYTVKGTDWSTTAPTGSGGTAIYQAAPETPMMDDILAAQRLYGKSTSSTLAGGQVFGFNCNITDGAKSFFDFTTNVNPVITLYDSGLNNTLDCSGFSTNCKINLNPGTFSTASAGTLTNNVGIAYDTHIDTAIGGSGDDSFIVNADSDSINGGAGSNSATFSGNQADYLVLPTGNGSGTVLNKTTLAVDTLTNVQTLNFADGTVTLVCFCTGSRIRTARGDVAVEDLANGDLAVTASGRLRPITWIGHRTVDCTAGSLPAKNRPSENWPVRVSAGAFGARLPERDLYLSPGHPVLVGADADAAGGWLVPIMCLINGTTIARVKVERATYWHVELDGHDILLAEGLPAESYLDWGDRAFFTEAADHALANPDFVVPGLTGRCRPVAVDGPVVEAERRRLDVVLAVRLDAACAWPGEGAALSF